jgi:thiamine-phosphate diphosphorylase
LRGGIRLVQVRAKGGLAIDLLDALVARVRAAGGTAIVNDDVSLALRADGVHLGQEDAAEHDLRALRARLGARAIGLSCGTPAEARAVDPVLIDYIGVGPIFATGSKADAGGPIGVNGVRVVVAATALPAAAIGGITLAGLPYVRETGAAMAAVISALANASDPETTARAFVRGWSA